MARISEISIKHEPRHYTITIRKTIHFMDEYAGFADQAFELTGSYLAEEGLFPISGPLVCFHNTDLDQLDVEIGWQTILPVHNKENICCSLVEARKVATTIDQGPYEDQDPTLTALFEWMKDNGHEPCGPIYYCYLNDTGRPDSEYLTQMSIPVK